MFCGKLKNKSFLNSADWVYKFCIDKRIPQREFNLQAAAFLSDIELKERF